MSPTSPARLGFPITGLPREEVMRRALAMKADDADWQHGRTWSLVYRADDEHDALLKDVYQAYFAENALSATAFPSLRRMEADIVAMVLDLLGADPGRAGGTMASGGTESIFLAVKAHRDQAIAAGRPAQGLGMVLPTTAHPAFVKAGHVLGMEVHLVPVSNAFTADIDAMADAIGPGTILLGASAPCYPYGVVDPIAELGQLADDHSVGLHVDACLGGFFLSVLRRAGRPTPPFAFDVAGVTSVTTDLHKYGYGPKGTSTVLYADRALRRFQYFTQVGWPGGTLSSPTLLGTRPGGAIAAAWAAITHLGLDGYTDLFERVMAITTQLQEGLLSIDGLALVGQPAMSVFAVGSSRHDVQWIADRLETEGWRIDRQQDPDCLHFIVNPGHDESVQPFVQSFRAAADLAPPPSGRSRPALYGQTATLRDEGDLDEQLLDLIDRQYDA